MSAVVLTAGIVLVKAQISQINSFLSELLSMVMLNLSSLLKRYWAAMMSIYFIQHPVKIIACRLHHLLPVGCQVYQMHYALRVVGHCL